MKEKVSDVICKNPSIHIIDLDSIVGCSRWWTKGYADIYTRFKCFKGCAMKIDEFVKALYRIANILEPFTSLKESKGLKWNGHEYIKKSENNPFDSIALVWWAKLTTIAEMIKSQGFLLTTEQIKYIEHQIFGGMGVLMTLCLILISWAKKQKERIMN